MTPPESPSSLLERAADLIEARESLAVIGPWTTCADKVTAGPDEAWQVADAHTSTTAAWIAMMSPSVATPLVAWLRAEANTASAWADTSVRWPDVPDSYRDAPPSEALKFARMVLGVPLEQEET